MDGKQGPRMPGGYYLPDYIRPVKPPVVFSELQLVRPARRLLEDWLELRSGDRMLLVSDSTTSELVRRAFLRAASERGVSVREFRIPISTSKGEPRSAWKRGESLTGLHEAYHARDWWPEEIWRAAKESGVIVSLSYLNPHAFQREAMDLEGFLRRHGLRMVLVTAVPEVLAAPWAAYPKDVLQATYQEQSRQLLRGGLILLQDPAGSSFRFEASAAAPEFDPAPTGTLLFFPPNYRVRLMARKGTGAGTLVAHSAPAGMVPLTRLSLSEGRLLRVEGGGTWGEYVKNRGEAPYEFSGLSWNLNPKPFRVASPSSVGPARLLGELGGHQRSGVVTLHFRQRRGSREFEMMIFFPSLFQAGRPFIRDGHVVALDAPDVLKVASAYGDPVLLVEQCTMFGAEQVPLPEPRAPSVKKPGSVEELMEAARLCVTRSLRAPEGSDVLLITDASVPALVNEALVKALREQKCRVVTREVEPPAFSGTPLQAWQQLRSRTLPPDLWGEVARTKFVLSTTYLPVRGMRQDQKPFAQWLAEQQVRFVSVVALPEIFASRWALQGTEVPRAMVEKLLEEVRSLHSVTLLDRRGTELMLDVQPVDRKNVEGLDLPDHGLLHFPPQVTVTLFPKPDGFAKGQVVTNNLLTGATAPLKLAIEQGRVQRFEGEASASVQQIGDALLSLSWGMSPAAFRLPATGQLKGSAFLWSWYAGGQRSGVLTLTFGTSEGIRTWEYQQYFPILTVEGAGLVKDVIVNGHVAYLDDPDIHAAVARFGDPEKLLKEDWIPPVGGEAQQQQ
ncbi:MAG: hypothetical protein HY652_12075 [Acidobacteria bacterium]|nr:hypothetical protein [Acidobacteriota bacterium]